MRNINKKNVKLSFIILIMFLILIIGIIGIINPTKYTSFVFRNSIIIFTIGLMGIIVSTYCIYQFGRKLFDQNARFSINSKGISDKVNILDYPFINWSIIIKIEECKVNNVPNLKVFINDSKQYINQKKGLKKWVLNFNYKKYQTPILLNNTFLSCSFEEYKKIILDSYNEYKRD